MSVSGIGPEARAPLEDARLRLPSERFRFDAWAAVEFTAPPAARRVRKGSWRSWGSDSSEHLAVCSDR